MVESLQTISVPTQKTITKVNAKKIEPNISNNFEITQNSTKII